VIKQVLIAVENEDKTEAQKAFREAVSVIDRMTDKGILHRNTAARHKSRLNTQLRSMG
jgi:small subunit ribosomal protein S20